MIILTDEEDVDFNLEALTEATIIFCLGVAIIVSNVVIIATFLNARGTDKSDPDSEFPTRRALPVDAFSVFFCFFRSKVLSSKNRGVGVGRGGGRRGGGTDKTKGGATDIDPDANEQVTCCKL